VERILWRAIRGQQLHGHRFRRQHPIGPYIADFACLDKKCVIELDGGQHQDQAAYDEDRTLFLRKQGWQVIRFWNNDVLDNLEGVVSTVLAALTAPPPS
jgi:primosomal protein N' (replication factor Y)